MVKDLPYPYTSKAQYERSLQTPIGTEWNTRLGFQRGTLPRVVKKVHFLALSQICEIALLMFSYSLVLLSNPWSKCRRRGFKLQIWVCSLCCSGYDCLAQLYASNNTETRKVPCIEKSGKHLTYRVHEIASSERSGGHKIRRGS